MATDHLEKEATSDIGNVESMPAHPATSDAAATQRLARWKTIFHSNKKTRQQPVVDEKTSNDDYEHSKKPEKWSMGVLNDRETDEVPGSVLLMSNTTRNEPLGLRNAPARTSASSLPSPFLPGSTPLSTRPSILQRQSTMSYVEEKKKTKDGKMILDPQPDESHNDPLNWPAWRRDVALLSLGFYCMVGGGMTPVLAAGFSNVAASYHVSIPQVALTTGLYMMGLGLGSVVMSPTAIIWGKRPVYLFSILLFILSAIWCALSPNYPSLVIARIFMGFAVSPCECLPSATIAEIFYLHERAYRLGIYTLLLLSGKNLIPLVSAAIIQGLDWQWVFWIVAMVVGLCFGLLFFFVPETFWDRTPRPHAKHKKSALASISKIFHPEDHEKKSPAHLNSDIDGSSDTRKVAAVGSATIAQRRQQKQAHHVGFAEETSGAQTHQDATSELREDNPSLEDVERTAADRRALGTHLFANNDAPPTHTAPSGPQPLSLAHHHMASHVIPRGEGPATPSLRNFNSPFYMARGSEDLGHEDKDPSDVAFATPTSSHTGADKAKDFPTSPARYTTRMRSQPPKTYYQTLKPWNGKLRHESWPRAAFRPFILFLYPSILWSAMVYALSVGWLIVLSESVSSIYKNKATYNFTSLQTGLVYIAPFIGGILGTAVAGKISDIIVRAMSRRNGGLYEPEFRLIMVIPMTIATCIGLMGFGWSAQERDNYIVPTVFFGIISFGCSLGSTTAITFAVDSYRQYAGEALVTLNFSKNIFHGLVFSLFFNRWLEADGSKKTFLAIGGIQLALLVTTTVPMFIYGKRARMWTVRAGLMEKF